MLKGASTGTTVLSYAESTQEVFQLNQSRKFLPAATVVSRNSHDWPLLSPAVPTSLGIGGTEVGTVFFGEEQAKPTTVDGTRIVKNSLNRPALVRFSPFREP
jgi:hypothetical protein